MGWNGSQKSWCHGSLRFRHIDQINGYNFDDLILSGHCFSTEWALWQLQVGRALAFLKFFSSQNALSNSWSVYHLNTAWLHLRICVCGYLTLIYSGICTGLCHLPVKAQHTGGHLLWAFWTRWATKFTNKSAPLNSRSSSDTNVVGSRTSFATFRYHLIVIIYIYICFKGPWLSKQGAGRLIHSAVGGECNDLKTTVRLGHGLENTTTLSLLVTIVRISIVRSC